MSALDPKKAMKVIPEAWLKLMRPQDRKQFGKGGMTADEAYQKFADRAEKDLHKLIWAELTRRGIVCIHSRMDRKSTTTKGLPDFCFVHDGTPFAVEVKTVTGQLTREQKTTMDLMRKNGWCVAVVRTFDEFLNLL